MAKKQNKVVICGGVRIPFVRSFGAYAQLTNKDMMTFVLKKLVEKYQLQGKKMGDVSLGAVMKQPRDFNLARESILSSGLCPQTPAFDIQRACGTSLEALIQVANKITLGQIEVGIAGGVDSNSDLPVTVSDGLRNTLFSLNKSKTMGQKLGVLSKMKLADLKPNLPSVNEPRTGQSMGQHCEKMAKEWGISRQEQDEQALYSQQKAAEAYKEGFYKELVEECSGMKRDQFVREDSSLDKMSQLRPAFDRKNGTLTAANSTPLTDGAAAVLLASEDYAKAKGLPILAEFVDGHCAAVDFVAGEGLLMAPTLAVAEMLQRNNLSLQDFDFYEIHEAFSAQLLCTLKAWESDDYCREKLGAERALGSIDKSKMNVVGGSVALGHPFAATGARITASLSQLLSQEKGSEKTGLISICTAGGMGVTAILKSPSL